MDLPAGVSASKYTYAGTNYANPHAVTQITTTAGATTTFTYDSDGNVTQVGTTTSYTYDYQMCEKCQKRS
jgi:YD repeat-containing protein